MLLATAVAVLLAAQPRVRAVTEFITSFPVSDHALSLGDFAAEFRRVGAVMLKFPASESLLEDSFVVVDRQLDSLLSIERIKMSKDDNVSANPLNVTTGVSPLRIRFQDHAVLAPADNTVQGPHHEGAAATRGNRRAIVFLCEEPAEVDGGTALFDMQKAWVNLPQDLKQRFHKAEFGFPQAQGQMLIVPAVVQNDLTGEPCLQYYCFGRTARDCVDVYRHTTGRYHVRPDPYQYEMHAEADVLLREDGGPWRPFLGLDLYRMLTSVYEAMISHSWSKGETLVVDNIRWAHARLDGAGVRRKVHFYYYGPKDWSFDLRKLPRPEL